MSSQELSNSTTAGPGNCNIAEARDKDIRTAFMTGP